MARSSPPHSKDDLTLNDVSQNRFGTRRSLLAGFDQFGAMSITAANWPAWMPLPSRLGRAHQQQDGGRHGSREEDPKVREQYGKGDAKNFGDGAPATTRTSCWPAGWWRPGRVV